MSVRRTAALMLATMLGVVGSCMQAQAASPRQDVQLIGLAPLYEVLFAAANCANVALDEPAFRRAARQYDLSPTDLTPAGDFAPEIAVLTADYRVRLAEDRAAFCDARRLRFAIPQGVLHDLGPEVPRPLLPFGLQRD